MGKKVMPVMALTFEAFYACIEQNVEVIYLDMEVYKAYTSKIFKMLDENGYDPSGYFARHGVFFAKGIDLHRCRISDPYRLF